MIRQSKMERQGQQQQLQFIYPVPFDDFVDFRRKQSEVLLSGFNIKQLGKLRKLKKVLQQTEEKINNRIKLFKKVSEEIRKRKQKQNIFHERKQGIKKQTVGEQKVGSDGSAGYMRSTKSSLNLIRVKKHSQGWDRDENSHQKKRYIEQKFSNAKQIKLQKQRNRAVMQIRKTKQMRQKLQSANIIRSHRKRAKQVKQLYEQQRYQEARKIKQERWKQEIEKYDELQENLTKLQVQERNALILWKRAMEAD